MAVSFDASGSATVVSGSVVSWSHTIGNNATGNRIVLASLLQNGSANITSIKFAGNAMTKIIAGTQGGNNLSSEIWYLLNPPTGLGTFNGTYSANTSPEIDAVSASYFGVNQTTPINGSASFIGTAVTSGSVTRTLTNPNSFWFGGASFDNTAGTTNIGNQRGTIGNGGKMMVADSTGGTVRWTDSTVNMVALGAEIAAFGATQNLIQSSGTAVLGIGSTSVSWGANTTTGNLIVVGVALTNAAVLGTVTSITDNQSNTYTKAVAGTQSSLGDVLGVELWYATNIVGGAGSVTVNHTIDNCAMFAREYTGYTTLDVTNSALGSSTTPNSGTSAATTRASELVVIVTGDDKGATQTWAAAGNYVDMIGTATTLTGLSMEDQFITTTGAQTGTLTLGAAANWDALLATFYQISGNKAYRSLLGVGV